MRGPYAAGPRLAPPRRPPARPLRGAAQEFEQEVDQREGVRISGCLGDAAVECDVGVDLIAAGEAMALAICAGADPEQVYEVITTSAGNSWMFQNRVPHILAGDYTPLSATAHQIYLQASAAGHGGEDDSAVIKFFPGIKLPGRKA